jgi:hypothetical protein
MSRYIPEHPKKGSAEAYAWAEKMRAARAKKARLKHTIREAGRKTEEEFFGPGGPLAPKALQKHQLNPKRKNREGVLVAKEKDIEIRQIGANRFHVKKSGTIKGAYNSLEEASQLKNFLLKNPGAKWHQGEEDVAYRYKKAAQDQLEKAFFAGVEAAHKTSGSAARKMGMNPKKKTRKNPIAVFNPSKVAGTIYNNAIEIKAQKTGGPLKGHYKHVFGSNVRILGLTDGTVLLQHKNGKPLWITRKEYERSGRKH